MTSFLADIIGTVGTKPLVYTTLLIVGIGGVAGGILVYRWAQTNRLDWWLWSVVAWILLATLFGVLLRWEYFTFGTAVVLALLIHSVSALIFDRFFNGVKLTNISLVGVIFALFALVLIDMGRSHET